MPKYTTLNLRRCLFININISRKHWSFEMGNNQEIMVNQRTCMLLNASNGVEFWSGIQ